MCQLYSISISIDILNQIFRFNNLFSCTVEMSHLFMGVTHPSHMHGTEKITESVYCAFRDDTSALSTSIE